MIDVLCYLALLEDSEFKKYMASAKTYFGKFVATTRDDWVNSDNALVTFQNFTESVPGGWLDGPTQDSSNIKGGWQIPCVYVYAKCMNCGQTAESVPIKHSVYELGEYTTAKDLIAAIKKALASG